MKRKLNLKNVSKIENFVINLIDFRREIAFNSLFRYISKQISSSILNLYALFLFKEYIFRSIDSLV